MRDRRLVKVWRDLWWHKARTSLVMLAIIVGLTTSGSVLNMWLLLQRVTQDGFRATNPASATIHLDSVDAGLLDAVRRMDGVAIVEPRRTIIGTIVHGDETRSALVFVSPDVAVRRIGMLEREDGAWPSRGTASIDRSSIPYAHVTLGDTVALRIGDQSPITLPVDGVVRDAGLPPGWMDHVVYTFITPATP